MWKYFHGESQLISVCITEPKLVQHLPQMGLLPDPNDAMCNFMQCIFVWYKTKAFKQYEDGQIV